MRLLVERWHRYRIVHMQLRTIIVIHWLIRIWLLERSNGREMNDLRIYIDTDGRRWKIVNERYKMHIVLVLFVFFCVFLAKCWFYKNLYITVHTEYFVLNLKIDTLMEILNSVKMLPFKRKNLLKMCRFRQRCRWRWWPPQKQAVKCYAEMSMHKFWWV